MLGVKIFDKYSFNFRVIEEIQSPNEPYYRLVRGKKFKCWLTFFIILFCLYFYNQNIDLFNPNSFVEPGLQFRSKDKGVWQVPVRRVVPKREVEWERGVVLSRERYTVHFHSLLQVSVVCPTQTFYFLLVFVHDTSKWGYNCSFV